MTNIIKISDQGSPLGCQQYDSNLDAVIERQNHIGTQTCDTISDLEECVEEFDFIQALKDQLLLLKDRIQQVENELFGDGDLGEILNQLRQDLEGRISALESDVDDLQTGQRTAENSIKSLEANLAALQELVNFQFNNLNTNINSLRQIYDALNASFQTMQTLINRFRGDLNAEVTARINGDNALNVALQTEATAREAKDTALQGAIDTERNQRLASLALKANLLSPTFTGVVTVNAPLNCNSVINAAHPAPTANTNELVTTNWVNSRFNERLPNLSGFARLSGSQFTGGVNLLAGGSTVTPAANANSEQIVNAAWVLSKLNALGSTDTSPFARTAGATFTGNVGFNARVDAINEIHLNGPINLNGSTWIRGALQVENNSQFHRNLTAHAGISVPGVAANANGVEVVNANWVNNRLNVRVPEIVNASGLGGGIRASITFAKNGGVIHARNVASFSRVLVVDNYVYVINLPFTPAAANAMGATFFIALGYGGSSRETSSDAFGYGTLTIEGNSVKFNAPSPFTRYNINPQNITVLIF